MRDRELDYISKEAQEIIGNIPHWLIRWGITVIFFVIIVLLFLSWLIKYPDTISVQVRIMQLNPNKISRISSYSNNTKYIGETFVNESSLVKIKKGQDMNIKLISYPFIEYGTLKGEIKSISDIPIDKKYKVIITLPNGLITSHKKRLKYFHGMTGNAEITIQNLRLIEKILYRFKNILKKE